MGPTRRTDNHRKFGQVTKVPALLWIILLVRVTLQADFHVPYRTEPPLLLARLGGRFRTPLRMDACGVWIRRNDEKGANPSRP